MSVPTKDRIISLAHGMSRDIRIQDLSSFFLSIQNNIFSHPQRITPYRNTIDNTTDGTNEVLQRFLYVNSKLYALGQVSSVSAVTKIYEKSGDVITSGWAGSTNGQDSAGANEGKCFVAYKGQAAVTYLYGFGAGNRIWAYDTSGGTALSSTDSALSVSYSNPSQGLVTSQDLLLIPYDNKVAVKDGGTSYNDNWESARLTLPSQLKIVDLEEYGTMVAITCQPVNPLQARSVVFLWDQVSPDITEAIDIGEGLALASFNIDGELYTVVNVGGGSSISITSPLSLRKYIGNRSSVETQRVDTESFVIETSNKVASTKVRDGNKYTFTLQTTLDGTSRINMWEVGRQAAGLPVVLTMGININNDTQPNSVQGVGKVGSYYFFAINSGTVVRTNDNGTYTATSTYISQKIIGHVIYKRRFIEALRFNKKLSWVGITCPPLPAGSTISLYYRIDSTTAWTKIFDYTTTNGISYQQGIDASGAEFLNFKELQFKLTSTGGSAAPAEWSSIDFEYEVLDNTTEE